MDRPVDKTLMAQRIRDLMEEYGDTTYSLAQYLGCDASAISHWLSKRFSPRAKHIDMMSVRFHAAPKYIMGKVDDRNFIVGGAELAGTEFANPATGEPERVALVGDYVFHMDSGEMSPSLSIGDRYFVAAKRNFADGDMVAFRKDDAVIVRRFMREGNSVKLYADNPATPMLIIPDRTWKDMLVYGKVVSRITTY